MATLLNGRLADWVSTIIALGPPIGKIPLTAQSITYPDHGVEKMQQYGTGKLPVGYTRDFYKPGQLEIEFLAAEWDACRLQMGPGYMETEIPAITISHVDPAAGLTPRTDSFLGCHIVKEQSTTSQGTDPLKTRVTFQPNIVALNGLPAVISPTI